MLSYDEWSEVTRQLESALKGQDVVTLKIFSESGVLLFEVTIDKKELL